MASTSQEVNVAQGDLEIKDSLTIRGVNGFTSVAWRAGAPTDKVFELLSDYNLNGMVDAAADVLWRSGSSASDGDDVGVLNGENDRNIWTAHFGNTLVTDGVTVA